MGCDIHPYVEVRDQKGRWVLLPEPRHFFGRGDSNYDAFLAELHAEYVHGIRPLPIDLPFNIEDFLTEDRTKLDSGKYHKCKHPILTLDERCYNTFAILAGVRNGRGFAGCKTGEGFSPISSPKGIPSDASREYRDEAKRWNGDGHSHSYLTLKELLEYDWQQTTVLHGTVSSIVYALWIKSGDKAAGKGPHCWSGGVSGPNVRHVSNEEMDTFVAEKLLPLLTDCEGYGSLNGFGTPKDKVLLTRISAAVTGWDHLYTQVSWTMTYAEATYGFHREVLPWLQSLGLPPDRVRICFFFDN